MRKSFRNLFLRDAIVTSKATDENAESVYTNYYDYSEPVAKIAGHRVLAIDRGEREGFLKVSVDVKEGDGLKLITNKYLKNQSDAEYCCCCFEDSYKRLIYPSIEEK